MDHSSTSDRATAFPPNNFPSQTVKTSRRPDSEPKLSDARPDTDLYDSVESKCIRRSSQVFTYLPFQVTLRYPALSAKNIHVGVTACKNVHVVHGLSSLRFRLLRSVVNFHIIVTLILVFHRTTVVPAQPTLVPLPPSSTSSM